MISFQARSDILPTLPFSGFNFNNNKENSIEDQHPNWTWRNKYGSNFEMTVEKLSLSQGSFQGAEDSTMSFRSQWTHHFPVDPGPDGTKPTVYVGGIILKNNEFLVVAGSTRAMGDGYGFNSA